MACRVDGAALSEVRSILGDRLIERPEQLTRVAADGSHLSCQPSACAIPRDPAEVQQLVRWARRHRVPLVVRGGGTSLDGESVPVPGAVVIDLSGWTTVHEIDPTDRIGRIGPGVLNRSLQEAAAPHGLFFPPNPGSWRTSSIGGNASTNASGPRSFRVRADPLMDPGCRRCPRNRRDDHGRGPIGQAIDRPGPPADADRERRNAGDLHRDHRRPRSLPGPTIRDRGGATRLSLHR